MELDFFLILFLGVIASRKTGFSLNTIVKGFSILSVGFYDYKDSFSFSFSKELNFHLNYSIKLSVTFIV